MSDGAAAAVGGGLMATTAKHGRRHAMIMKVRESLNVTIRYPPDENLAPAANVPAWT